MKTLSQAKVRTNRLWRWCALLVVASVVMAACGDDDDASEDASPSTTGETADEGAADSDEWQAVLDAANEEGKVVWYSPQAPAAADQIKADFEKRYPDISLEFTRLVTGDAMQALEAERTTGADGADFVGLADPPSMRSLNEDGFLSPIIGPEFEALSSTVFAEYPNFVQTPNSAIYGGEAHYIVWNTSLVDEPISDYQDFVDRAEEFDGGDLGIPDLSSQPTIAVWTQIEEQVDQVDLHDVLVGGGDVDAAEFLPSIANLDPARYAGAVPSSQAVAAGEVKASVGVAGILLAGLKESGAPVDGIISPSAPSSVAILGAIPKASKRPNAAQVFMNYLLSPEGQEASNGGGSVAILDDVPGAVGGPETLNPIRFEVLEQNYNDAFTERWNRLFG